MKNRLERLSVCMGNSLAHGFENYTNTYSEHLPSNQEYPENIANVVKNIRPPGQFNLQQRILVLGAQSQQVSSSPFLHLQFCHQLLPKLPHRSVHQDLRRLQNLVIVVGALRRFVFRSVVPKDSSVVVFNKILFLLHLGHYKSRYLDNVLMEFK